MSITYASIDRVSTYIAQMPLTDINMVEAAELRQGQLTKPPGSLGRLEQIAIWLAGWQEQEKPEINAPACLIFAGNHGITNKGVSAFPSEVTEQMVLNFQHGGAAINQLCKTAGASLNVFSLSLDKPTADFSEQPAMSIDDTLAAMQIGADAIPDNADLILPGEMGIGNTSSAAALSHLVFGDQPATWTGRGTGLDDDRLAHKTAIIKQAVARIGDRPLDAVTMLSELGGRELAAIAGCVLAARLRRIPVLLDGFISTAACLPLWAANEHALDHCQISHYSKEPGHRHVINALGKPAILDLDLRLGEASGAAIALMIVKAALCTHNGMATFAEAGVSDG
ncbi:MAG: nicotinate-nucleotide--dimethylbenzimidazole phosphoribosyltransferase [Candidatus Puniceispirillum sp. TMED52]|nr:nicotinate-nucleotide--dimethylbenzimidazole phosphoribosyltransferase [SAR116 cluster bacterium]OUU53915.1 MAG: nicotinate-nucleotide--dimethylbenzimidazole phosphoribosyltransferase [Candidatus Puniceispirillum sp. TMED52]